jgi:hypothetical protein
MASVMRKRGRFPFKRKRGRFPFKCPGAPNCRITLSLVPTVRRGNAVRGAPAPRLRTALMPPMGLSRNMFNVQGIHTKTPSRMKRRSCRPEAVEVRWCLTVVTRGLKLLQEAVGPPLLDRMHQGHHVLVGPCRCEGHAGGLNRRP